MTAGWFSGISAIELTTGQRLVKLSISWQRDGYEAGLMERDAEVNRSPLRAWKHDRDRDLKYALLA